MRRCVCEDWNENIDKLLMASYLYVHGYEYTGALMRYCPWCGAILDGVPIEEIIEVKLGSEG